MPILFGITPNLTELSDAALKFENSDTEDTTITHHKHTHHSTQGQLYTDPNTADNIHVDSSRHGSNGKNQSIQNIQVDPLHQSAGRDNQDDSL